jgi:hypothetical protein
MEINARVQQVTKGLFDLRRFDVSFGFTRCETTRRIAGGCLCDALMNPFGSKVGKKFLSFENKFLGLKVAKLFDLNLNLKSWKFL